MAFGVWDKSRGQSPGIQKTQKAGEERSGKVHWEKQVTGGWVNKNKHWIWRALGVHSEVRTGVSIWKLGIWVGRMGRRYTGDQRISSLTLGSLYFIERGRPYVNEHKEWLQMGRSAIKLGNNKTGPGRETIRDYVFYTGFWGKVIFKLYPEW